MTIAASTPRRRLPSRYFAFAFGTMMALFMSLFMSGVVTAKNVGFGPHYVQAWMTAWGLAFPIAWPTILVVAPLARRITARFVEPPKAG